MTFGPANSYSSYLSSEFDLPTDPDKQRDFINKRERLTASILNVKSNGNYEQRELLSADQWFTSIVNNATVGKSGFRFTFNLVELNANTPIPPGVTNINLWTQTPPIIITNITYPLPSYGSGTIAGPIYVFTGTDFNVTFDNTNPIQQIIQITNNTAANLTSCFWAFNYLKQAL
jgi:hypothetical protein